jgi:hypothetical protein
MKKFIHSLRQKPEKERRHLLHILTIIAAIIMIILWIYSLGRSLTSSETKERIRQDLKPFSVLKDNLVGGYKSIAE